MWTLFGLLFGVTVYPLAFYIVGRILLPEIGLSAPGYGTWLVVTVISLLFYMLDNAVSAVIKTEQ